MIIIGKADWAMHHLTQKDTTSFEDSDNLINATFAL